MRRPNIKRRAALAAGSALIAGAAVGGYLAMSGGTSSVHLTAAPTVQAPAAAPGSESTTAPDADTLQQGDQSGTDTTAAGTAAAGTAATAAEAPSTEADAAGGHTDAAGTAGPDGNFNN